MTTTNACSRCGTPLPSGARYCSRCGFDTSGEQTGAATEKMAATAVDEDPQAGLIDELRRATIGEFDIATELGRGGMATVFLAHEIALDRKVAIKVMSPALLSSGKGMADRFKREARTAAALSHPHIIPIYGVRESGRLLFFVMKFVQGRALDAIIKEHGALPVKMVQMILAQAGGALDYAHRHGIVHRDIKPANIMLDTDGWTIVTDFGIAKVRESQGLTMTGATIGTPTYMSPEQCSAKEITGATDQYSLGITAYEMLTGRVPFDADSVMSLMWQHFHEPPPPLTSRRPDCPPALANAIERMLAKSAADRWPSLEEAIEAIGSPPANDPIRQQMKALAKSKSGLEETAPHTPISPVPKATTPAPTATATPPAKPAKPMSKGPVPPPVVTGAPTTPIPATSSPAAPTTPIPASKAEAPPRLPMTPLEPIGPPVSREITESPTAILSSTPVPPTAPAPPKRTMEPAVPTVRSTGQRPSGATSITGRQARVEPPAARPAKGGALKWVGLGVAAAVIAVAAWAMIGRKQPAVVPPASPGTPTVAAPVPVASITVTPSPAAIVLGGTAQLAAVLKDAKDGTLPLTGRTVIWTSSDTTMARVSAIGTVTAVAQGYVTVTATSEGKSGTGTVMVTVTAAPVVSVEIGTVPPLSPGDTALLSAAPKDAHGNVLSGRSVTWSSSDRTIAAVSPAGTVIGGREGTAVITAVVEGKRGSTHLTVSPAAVTIVNITPPAATIQIGAKTQLAAAGHDGRDRTLTGRTVTWSSSDRSIATVATDGTVTGVAQGQATITAQIESQGATAAVTVTPIPVATVTVTPATVTLAVGKTSQLTVGLKDARGGTIRERDVTWTSSDLTVASVSPSGLVTATRGGSVAITATSDGVKGTATITVPTPATPAPATPPPAAVANNPPPTQPVSKQPVESQPSTPAATPAPAPSTPAPQPAPAASAAAVPRRNVVAGAVHTCALTQAGAPLCWGSNEFGQLGDASLGATSSYPVSLSGAPSFTVLAAGNNHTCGLTSGGSAVCWGGNLKGQLGNGKTAGPPTASPVAGGHVFASIVAGARHTCGLTADGTAWCWGDNDAGQLGEGSKRGANTPQRVAGGVKFKMLAAGSEHTCALGNDGKVYCWGDGFSGQIGRGSLESQVEPVPVDIDMKFTTVVAGGKHACALAVNGKAYCWGANVSGEVGDGSKDERDRPVAVAGGHTFVALTAGSEHSCGLGDDGSAYCWGRNREGQLGDGSRADKPAPVKVAAEQSLQSIDAGGNHSCGVTQATVVCWGGNARGQLGDGTQAGRLTPKAIEAKP